MEKKEGCGCDGGHVNLNEGNNNSNEEDPCKELCECYHEAYEPKKINSNWLLLVKDPCDNHCKDPKFYKFTMRDLCHFIDDKLNPPRPCPIECDEVCKGFGVRYRNFDSDAGEKEIYIGKGDLGVGANRYESDYEWDVDPNSFVLHEFKFKHFRAANTIRQEIKKVTDINYVISSFSPLVTGGDIKYEITGGGEKEVDPNELDAFQLTIANRVDEDLNVVILKNLFLRTSVGSVFPILNNGSTVFAPSAGEQLIVQFEWPKDGSSPAGNFCFEGQIQLKGRLGKREQSKVEILIFKCIDNPPM